MWRPLLPELAAAPLLPLLLAQGRRVRRNTPRLPEAGGPRCGSVGLPGDMPPLTLLTVGESPVAGVGVSTHEEAITGQLALALSAALGRSVAWQACGKNGVTVAEALEQLPPMLPADPVDVAAIAFGVNDTTAFRRPAQWSADLEQMWEMVRMRCRPRLILLCGVPPVGRFPALPQPLRWVLGLKAEVLDGAAQALARRLPDTVHVPVALEPACHDLMAADGYHPSALGCARWAAVLADACAGRLR
ncbi:SGNH/GDSL hydrolase family protein [Noviherbaspirillum aridicola]|uniref:SGNH hydrolase n=1 Tax=Noviherbaspirillum aridicola TaxID=2849687 RepID=A0ABQ4QA45_9BURK|nr:SGNH/GDSL hydrolase family protein [Noviherbaspirillum aridicola]GIZ54078.1 SGNH hydrolase [Noviherbaspirillum aridicola]